MTRLFVLLIPLVVLAASGPAERTAGTTNPATAARHWSASVKAETNKNYDEALTEAAAYKSEGGDEFMAALRLGWLNYLNGDFANAEKNYGRASRMRPGSVNALLGLLNTAQAQKDPKKTAMSADVLLREDPSNYKARMVLAGIYFAEKDYRKAANEYRQVLNHYPDDQDAMSGTAWSAYYTGEKREAQDLFRCLLSVNPEYPSAQTGADLAAGKSK